MNTPQQIAEIFERYIALVNMPDEPQRLYAPIRYSLAEGGKRMRPVLTMLAYNIYADDIQRVLPAAAAVEVFHAVQVMALKSLLSPDNPCFKGLKVTVVGPSANGYYRYVTASGSRSDATDALKSVRRKFPDAYVVRVAGNEVQRVK